MTAVRRWWHALAAWLTPGDDEACTEEDAWWQANAP